MSEEKPTWWRRFRQSWANAFAPGPHGPLTDEDRAFLDKIADAVIRRQMQMPAILFLQSVRPLNGLGSQALVFLRPFLTGLFKEAVYDRVTAILERREGLTALVEAIETRLPGSSVTSAKPPPSQPEKTQ